MVTGVWGLHSEKFRQFRICVTELTKFSRLLDILGLEFIRTSARMFFINTVFNRQCLFLQHVIDASRTCRQSIIGRRNIRSFYTPFVQEMSWDNYGKWHVYHVRPCSLFDQQDAVQFAECWALSNLQPLWAEDNVRKGNRI